MKTKAEPPKKWVRMSFAYQNYLHEQIAKEHEEILERAIKMLEERVNIAGEDKLLFACMISNILECPVEHCYKYA